MTDLLTPDTIEEIKHDLREEFCSIIDGMIIDPQFEYNVESIQLIEREPAFPTDVRLLFLLNIATNNRAQLLGQATPFEQGDYRGYYNNLYGGWLTELLADEYSLNFRYYVDVNTIPMDNHYDYFDREISLETALNKNIVEEGSLLVKKMEEYNLDSLVIGGGTLIAGPLPGPISTMEQVCERYRIETVLDLFCGSGSFTKVALQNGAHSVSVLDLDLASARDNLQHHSGSVRFIEGDSFEFTPSEKYDLVLADPYFHLLPEFIQSKYPELAEATERILITAGFKGDTYWFDKIETMIQQYSTQTERIDTGRTVQILSHHD